MSLTGSLFLNGIIAITIAAFVATIVIWPRLTPSKPWHVAGRVGALLLINVLVLLTAATQLNASYLFFASWGDLQGAVTGHIAQTSLHRGGVEATAPNLKVKGKAAAAVANPAPVTLPPGSTGLVSYTVHGAASGLTGTVLVQIPLDYNTSGATTRYPVLEAFHGYPSEPLNWVKVFHINQAVARAVQAHQLRQPLIVMPQIEFPRGADTEGVNGQSGQPQVETWLTRDVPTWVGQTFRVVPNRNAWATIGYSTGGYVAAMATVLHPAQYGAGIVLGGYFRPDFGPFYEPFTSKSPQGRRYDLAQTVSSRPPPVSLWVETSHADPLSYRTSAQFMRVTKAPMAVRAVVLQNAGHRDSVWIGLLPQALQWLGKTVHGFVP